MESLLTNFIEKQEQLQEYVLFHFKIQFVRLEGSAFKSNLMTKAGASAYRLLHGLDSVPQDFWREQQLSFMKKIFASQKISKIITTRFVSSKLLHFQLTQPCLRETAEIVSNRVKIS